MTSVISDDPRDAGRLLGRAGVGVAECETARVAEIDTALVKVVLLVPADAVIAPTASTPRMASAMARVTQT